MADSRHRASKPQRRMGPFAAFLEPRPLSLPPVPLALPTSPCLTLLHPASPFNTSQPSGRAPTTHLSQVNGVPARQASVVLLQLALAVRSAHVIRLTVAYAPRVLKTFVDCITVDGCSQHDATAHVLRALCIVCIYFSTKSFLGHFGGGHIQAYTTEHKTRSGHCLSRLRCL